MKQAQRCDKKKIEQTGWSPFGNSLTRRELSETTLTLCHHIKSPNMYVYQSATLVFLYLNRNIFSGHGLRCPFTGRVIVNIIIITITIITTTKYRHHNHLLRSRDLVSVHWTGRRSAPASRSPQSSPSTSPATASPPCRLSTASRLWRGELFFWHYYLSLSNQISRDIGLSPSHLVPCPSQIFPTVSIHFFPQ